MVRICLLALALVVTWLGAGGSAYAQGSTYPSRPVRLLLPFPAGSPSDLLGRAVGQRLSEQLGVAVVPDNRVGAGGNLGLELAARAPGDGYTLVVASPGIALSPSLYAKLNYDAARDLTPVARLAAVDNVMLVHPSVPTKTLQEFIALARRHPGKLNYGSGGAGTTNHLANELLKLLARIDIVHVPYKGATLAANALMTGEVDQVIVSIPSTLGLIRAGKVRALAVLADKRSAALPEVPTSAEAGLEGFTMSIWWALYGPGSLQPALQARLNRETVRALESPAFKAKLAAMGYDAWPSTPEQLAQFVQGETTRYARIVKSAGIQPQ
jgi:tripartite-type tricarboxylate transporter receptor subunit TctC